MQMKWILTLCVLLLISSTIYSQELRQIQCGDIVESAFTKNKQIFKYSIKLQGGDKLKIFIKGKYDELLKMTYEIYGPSRTKIFGTFDRRDAWKNKIEATTPEIPATGIYQIFIYNYFYNTSWNKGALGDFTLYVSCIKQDGTVIEFGDIEEVEESKAKENVLSNALKIPIGTSVEGEFFSNSDNNYAFKTSLEAGKPLKISLNILKGQIPIKFSITNDLSKEIISESALKYSKSITNTIVVPKDGNYIILISKDNNFRSSNGKTEFSIKLEQK